MASIFPDTNKGGIIVSSGGVATGATGVTNAYLPIAGYTVTCPVTAYGDANCSWQLSGAALNAVNTEMAMLAQQMNPTGTWNCGAVGNLAANFAAWATANASPFTGAVAAAPVITNDIPVPTTHFGTSVNYLGSPVRWISLTIPGVTGVVTFPSYT